MLRPRGIDSKKPEKQSMADAIHLTGGNGSMEFPALVPSDKPMHLHFLESKPGIHDDVSHLKPDGSGGWRPKFCIYYKLVNGLE